MSDAEYRMEDRLRAIERQVDKMQAVAETVHKHEEAIYGNGEQGLKTKVELLDDGVTRLSTSLDKRATREWSILLGIVILIIETLFTQIF